MPELLFDIKLQLDEASEKTIKSRLNAMQKEVNESTGGTTSAKNQATKATKKQADAERELYREFKRQVTLNEVKFRQGELSQKQALESANAIEQQAIEQGVLTDATLRGAQAQKTMFLSQQRIETGFTGMAKTSATANRSLINLGRIVQDLPFGFLGISNNIDPALTSMRELKEDSGGVKGAFTQLLGALKGPGGVIFALGSLLPTAVLISQQGWNMFSKKTKDAEDALQSLNKTTRSFIDESARLRVDDGGFLSVFDIQAKIESTNRLVKVFSDEFKEFNKQIDASSRSMSSFGVTLNNNSIELGEAESSLSSIKDQFKLTNEDMEAIIDGLKEFNTELRRAKAQASLDPLALFRDDIERTVEQQIEFVEAGLQNVTVLKNLRSSYTEQAIAIRESGFEGENAMEKYMLLRKVVMNLNSAIDENTMSAVVATEATKDSADAIQKEIDARKRRLELMKLERNMPKDTGDIGGDETRALAASAFVRSLESDIQFQSQLDATKGLAQRKLEIDRKYEEKRLEIIKQFGSEEQQVQRIFDLLDKQRKREHEQALTEIEKQETKKREDFKMQAIRQSFAMASSILSSLQQLNQAQTDETEKQARQKFETQKSLAKAQAVVAGAAAAVETWKNMGGFPLAIPFVAAQAAATAVQLRAIEKTQFNSASFDQDIGAKSQSGFFETDVPQSERREPRRPNQVQPVNIALRGEFDEEVLSIKAERGKEKRMRGAIFTI